MPGFGDAVEVILVLAVVFYLTWFVTRFVAKRSKGKASGRFMQVVDRLNISNDKAMLLVKIGSEYCVIGVTGHEMRLIKTLDETESETFAAELADKTDAWPAGGAAAGAVWKGMQSFGERLGFAMKRPPVKPPEPAKPGTQIEDDESVIDMMNERIKLRKDSKWR
jgi:flagellar biosynthetic protein FliO